MPLIRQGVISTSLFYNFNSKPEFLIDCYNFVGSSGSPIFVSKNNRFYLVGIQKEILIDDEIDENIGFSKCVNSDIIKEFMKSL